MKKILLVLLAIASLSTTVIAQDDVEKGKFVFGTGLAFSGIGSTLSLNISGSYFITDHIAILGQISLGSGIGGFYNEYYSYRYHNNYGTIYTGGDLYSYYSYPTLCYYLGFGFYFTPESKGSVMLNLMIGGSGDGYGFVTNLGYSFFLSKTISLSPYLHLGLPFEEDFPLGGKIFLGPGVKLGIHF